MAFDGTKYIVVDVAPFTGAWIEIDRLYLQLLELVKVAPFTGAWIEMRHSVQVRLCPFESHPSRVRGLKYGACRRRRHQSLCRTLHGCVD